MLEELCLPVFAAVVLLSYLVCAVRQLRSEKEASPTVVWRETAGPGWSEWSELIDVRSNATYDSIFATVSGLAHPAATAVQFAVIAHPDDAPDYTIQVLFMSDVREPVGDRDLMPTSCGG